MPDFKERRRGFALNMDDAIPDLKPGEVTDALNMRLGNSTSINSAGIPETLQGEIGILLEVASEHLYYGGAIGGDFIYSGYEEVAIGNQVWMKRNWDADFPGSKVYNDDEDNADEYGRLYNHAQVMDADFVPDGWRVPTEADIDELLTFLGGALIAGGKLKEYAENHWITPNTGATDEVGFKALPGGRADVDAAFELLQLNGFFWLQDEGEPLVPEGLAISGILYNQATATWTKTATANGYKLDVAEDDLFTSFVAGFEDLDVGNVDTYDITGLSADTPYYVRARGYNEIGDGENCDAVTFDTLEDVQDFDGNRYSYVTIGTQQWMVENFRSEHYADGTAIPNLTLDADWIAEDGTPGHDGAMCYYDNDEATYKPDYGALYNWYAVDNAHGLAPAGWRVANDTDWNTLATFIHGDTYEAGKLKSLGLTYWDSPNTLAIDSYGFDGRGGGYRDETGAFKEIRQTGMFSVDLTESYANLYYNSYILDFNLSVRNDKWGSSVRMMRDV